MNFNIKQPAACDQNNGASDRRVVLGSSISSNPTQMTGCASGARGLAFLA
jgi:hypothetical protein